MLRSGRRSAFIPGKCSGIAGGSFDTLVHSIMRSYPLHSCISSEGSQLWKIHQASFLAP